MTPADKPEATQKEGGKKKPTPTPQHTLHDRWRHEDEMIAAGGIHSFPGKAPTSEEKILIDKIVTYLNKQK